MSRDLSAHQKKRIRTADAENLGRMVHQEAYWTTDALLRILERVEVLMYESPEDAESAARHSLRILGRLIAPHPELRALTLSIHGSALRSLGRHDEALKRYEEALLIPGLSPQARCGVLRKQTAALVFKGLIEEGLQAVGKALELQPGDITALGVRSWARFVACDYQGTLDDCLLLLERAHARENRRAFLAAVVNASAALRLEAFTPNQALAERLLAAVGECRRHLPHSGTGFYSLTRARALLYRAEALILGHLGRHREGAKLLRRSFERLVDKFPDDAFFAAVDLACSYAFADESDRASQACVLIFEVSDRIGFQLHRQGLPAVKAAIERGTLSDRQAIEMRSLLMPALI